MTWWDPLWDPVVTKGLVQAGAVSMLALLVVGIAAWRRLDLESEMLWSLLRGVVQILAMGALLGLLLTVTLGWSVAVVLGMVLAAAWISKDRSEGIPGAFRISLVAIGFGSGTVIVVAVLAGTIETSVENLVPVASIVIVAGMRTQSLALDRLSSEVQDHRERIEQLLALGASPARAIRRHVRASVEASLIPVLDSLKSLGLVWIPGFMAGMVLAGENPIYAALYQFAVMAMVFACAGLTTLGTSLLSGRSLFTGAHQLALDD